MSSDPSSSSSTTKPVVRVLIIDDNEDVASLLKDYLELEEIECKIIDGGLEGLEEIRKNNGCYDLIFLDLAMPEYSGLDVFDKLREENLLASNNVIIFTASSIQDNEISSMIDSGAKHILKKPCTLDQINDVVTKFIIKKDKI